jgi:hypothetical protein
VSNLTYAINFWNFRINTVGVPNADFRQLNFVGGHGAAIHPGEASVAEFSPAQTNTPFGETFDRIVTHPAAAGSGSRTRPTLSTKMSGPSQRRPSLMGGQWDGFSRVDISGIHGIPEPSTYAFMLAGDASILWVRRRDSRLRGLIAELCRNQGLR